MVWIVGLRDLERTLNSIVNIVYIGCISLMKFQIAALKMILTNSKTSLSSIELGNPKSTAQNLES